MNKTASLFGPTTSIGRSDDGYEEENFIEQNTKMNSTFRINEPEPFDASSYTNNRSKFMNVAVRKNSVIV